MDEQYQGPDRRKKSPDPWRDKIEKDICALKDGLAENTKVTQQVKELLEMPANFWAWCGKWGKRVSNLAKITAPIVALGVALNQFLHIDILELILKVLGWKR